MTNDDSALQALNKLVGTWKVSGGHDGTVTYRWLNDFFLQQDVDLSGAHGIEIIGRERTFMAEPSADIKSRYYGDDGSTLDYTYELLDDKLTIWGGDRGSPAYFEGSFSSDGRKLSGAWVYPGGGGYDSIAERID